MSEEKNVNGDINPKISKECLNSDEYFMGLALLAAQRSKDPVTQVGACIVDEDGKVLSLGYNGMPDGRDDIFPWGKDKNKSENKHSYVCHAETNAIANKHCCDLKNSTMYVTLHPCNECAKLIVQFKIKSVIYLSDKYADKDAFITAKDLFRKLKFECRQYIPQRRELTINFK